MSLNKKALNGLKTFAVLFILGTHSRALANASGHTVVSGEVTVGLHPNNSNHQIINQHQSNKAIVNWQRFGNEANQIIEFVQPNSGSLILNRVIGGEASIIQGQLKANGQVFLVNNAGIFFTPTAIVDVAGLVATTANITDRDFLTGNRSFQFKHQGRPTAVVNQGLIRSSGIVALVAPGVENQGTIEANLGSINLGSGQEFVVNFYENGTGGGHIHFATGNAAIDRRPVDAYGRLLSDGVKNSGSLIAPAGKISLTGKAAEGILENVINLEGGSVIRATTAVVRRGEGQANQEGIISLRGNGGKVRVAGELDVSGCGSGMRGGEITVEGDKILVENSASLKARGDVEGGKITLNSNETRVFGMLDATGISNQSRGGEIKVLGDRVLLEDLNFIGTSGSRIEQGAIIDASGGIAGGKIYIGGDYLGGNPEIRNSNFTFLGKNVRVKANAFNQQAEGRGGRVILWSDDLTYAFGKIEALGTGGRNGGFIETSGKTNVIFYGTTEHPVSELPFIFERFRVGEGGTYLMDPDNADIFIRSTPPTPPSSGGTFVPLAGVETWVPTSNTCFIYTGDIEGFLNAGTSVTIQQTGTGSGPFFLQENDINKTSGGDATLTYSGDGNGPVIQANIISTSGRLNVVISSANVGSAILSPNTITTNGGDFSVVGGWGSQSGTLVDCGAGSFNSTGGTVNFGAINAGGGITADTQIILSSAQLNAGGADITFGGAGGIISGTNSLIANTINFNSTFDGAGSLTFNANTVNINSNIGDTTALTTLNANNVSNFNIAAGVTVTNSNDINLNNIGNFTNNGTINTGTFTQSSGTGLTNLGNPVTGGQLNATGQVSITGNDVTGTINVRALTLTTTFADPTNRQFTGTVNGVTNGSNIVLGNTFPAGTHFFNNIDLSIYLFPPAPPPPAPSPPQILPGQIVNIITGGTVGAVNSLSNITSILGTTTGTTTSGGTGGTITTSTTSSSTTTSTTTTTTSESTTSQTQTTPTSTESTETPSTTTSEQTSADQTTSEQTPSEQTTTEFTTSEPIASEQTTATTSVQETTTSTQAAGGTAAPVVTEAPVNGVASAPPVDNVTAIGVDKAMSSPTIGPKTQSIEEVQSLGPPTRSAGSYPPGGIEAVQNSFVLPAPQSPVVGHPAEGTERVPTTQVPVNEVTGTNAVDLSKIYGSGNMDAAQSEANIQCPGGICGDGHPASKPVSQEISSGIDNMMAPKPKVVTDIESVVNTGKTGYSEPVEYTPEAIRMNVVADDGVPAGRAPLQPEFTAPIDAAIEKGG